MKQRLIFLLKLALLFLVVFALEKPFFMLYNLSGGDYSFTDWIKVVLNGLKLDSSVTGYFLILPWIVTLISFWLSKIPIKKILTPYYFILALIMSVMFTTDMCLYEFWGFKLDATIFNYIDSPKNVFASVSVGYVVLRLLLIAVLTALFFFIMRKLTPDKFKKIDTLLGNLAVKKTASTFLWLLLVVPIFITIRGGVKESTSNVGRVYFCSTEFLNHSAVNPIFSFIESVEDYEKFSEQFNFFSEQQRAEIFAPLYPQPSGVLTDTLLSVDKPNILLIALESFGGIVTERCGGLKDVNPNLERIFDEGIYFSNFYANSFRTDRGLVSILSGYLGQPTTSIMKISEKCGHLPGLARSLKSNGYSTSFLYGGDINFTNMNGYLLATGYEKIISDVDMPMRESKSGKWGAQDEFTCKRLIDEIKTLKSPWHFAYLTLSSHEPFDVPYKRLDHKVANSFAYTDLCIGGLINNLKTLPVWDSLLVVILPDHNIRNVDLPNHLDVSNPDFYHVPMVWTGGAIKKQCVVDKMLSQTDLVATLLAQLGIDYKDFTFSRNVFDTTYVYPFAFSAYNNGIVFRDSTGATVYDNNAEKVIFSNSDSYNRENNAKAILQTLYDDLDLR